MSDNVIHPIHYNQGGVECIEAIKAATVGKTGIEAFCVGNAIKYLWRYENKNGLEDVKKAAFYINRLISELEAKEHKEDTSFDYDFIPNDEEYKGCNKCVYAQNTIAEKPCCDCKYGNPSSIINYDKIPCYFKSKEK